MLMCGGIGEIQVWLPVRPSLIACSNQKYTHKKTVNSCLQNDMVNTMASCNMYIMREVQYNE